MSPREIVGVFVPVAILMVLTCVHESRSNYSRDVVNWYLNLVIHVLISFINVP